MAAASKKESKFRETNSSTERTVKHALLAPGEVPVKAPPRKSNQHTKSTWTVELNYLYQDLIKACVKVKSTVDAFECWVPDQDSIGLTWPEYARGYTRVRFDGGAIQTHVFVFLYHRPMQRVPDGMDVSHRCGNSLCCRPSHLTAESRDVNLSRRTCAGIIYETISQTYFRLCRHEPICCVSSVFNSDTDALLPNQLLSISKDQS